MDKIIVEVCCGSYDDVVAAKNGGADRVELNSALYLGGLTPSFATVKKSLDLGIKIIAMVRPRGAGFCYTENEFEIMKDDAKAMLEMGVDGIAFGCLKEDKTLDYNRNKQLVDLVHQYQKEAVFHRAFDCVDDVDGAMKQLIELGVDRLLTSGQKEKAMDGIDCIAYLQKEYGKCIEILAGSGVNDQNALDLITKTKVIQLHSSCKTWKKDASTSSTHVSFAYHPEGYEVVEEVKVKQLVEVCRK